MSVQDDLERLFPGHRSRAFQEEWEDAKHRFPLGSLVRGNVVAQYPFGVFINFGIGFPALILVVRLKDADRRPYRDIEHYPAIGSQAEGRIYVWADEMRQIGITQLAGELMLGE
jgi:hypothetical protein